MRNVLISTLNCSATKTVMSVCLMIFLMPLERPACYSTLVTPDQLMYGTYRSICIKM